MNHNIIESDVLKNDRWLPTTVFSLTNPLKILWLPAGD